MGVVPLGGAREVCLFFSRLTSAFLSFRYQRSEVLTIHEWVFSLHGTYRWNYDNGCTRLSTFSLRRLVLTLDDAVLACTPREC